MWTPERGISRATYRECVAIKQIELVLINKSDKLDINEMIRLGCRKFSISSIRIILLF